MNLSSFFCRSRGLRQRITVVFGSFVAIAMLSVAMVVSYRLISLLTESLESDLDKHLEVNVGQLAQRFDYLLESAQLLSKNSLLINGISDSQSRKTYLPKMVSNFEEGRDVQAVALLDFDGRPVYTDQPSLPTYQDSRELRTALNYGVVTHAVDAEHKLWRVFVPVLYYGTTQGALLVDFDLPAIVKRVLPVDPDLRHRLFSGNNLLYVRSSEIGSNLLVKRQCLADNELAGNLGSLDLELEVAMSRAKILAPTKRAFRDVALLGLLLTMIGIILASWLWAIG
jgi:hypothetical protein